MPTSLASLVTDRGSRVLALLGIVVAIQMAIAAAPARAYRDLQTCPDLMPQEPLVVADPAARRCERVVAAASRRFVDTSLKAHAGCFLRLQSGQITGTPASLCRGLVRLSTGAFDAPTDLPTASALASAAARLDAEIRDGCSDAAAAALGGCAPTAAGLATCVLASQRDHALDVLDQQFADVAVLADRRARACQHGIDRAARRYLTRITSAHERCLRRQPAGTIPGARADQCLGSVQDGIDVPPAQSAAAARIARGRTQFVAAVQRSCPAPVVASLDTCGRDPARLTSCLDCVLRREAMLLVQGRQGGVVDRPTTHFLDWGALVNPVLQDPNRLMKNQAILWADDWFWVVAPNRLRRTQDFRTYQDVATNDGRWFGDIGRVGGQWVQTTNGNVGGDMFEIFARTSSDLVNWSPLGSITPGLFATPTIDGALLERDGYVFLALKERIQQLPYVTRSVGSAIDGNWLPPQRAYAGATDAYFGFSEAFHFLEIDGQVRLVGTARDPEPYRCTANPIYFIYTCSHEPFIYTLPDVTSDLATWTDWRHKTHLRVPFEAWNPIMHANSGQLVDWREHDGFFYLSYAGADDGESFELRGHGKIGLARSRDLVHWRVAGDLRD